VRYESMHSRVEATRHKKMPFTRSMAGHRLSWRHPDSMHTLHARAPHPRLLHRAPAIDRLPSKAAVPVDDLPTSNKHRSAQRADTYRRVGAADLESQ
jgi:hypothetical protein